MALVPENDLGGREVEVDGAGREAPALEHALLVLLVLMLLIGLASIPLANFMANRNQPQNMAAWSLALLAQIYYLLLWLAWRWTGFRAAFKPQP